MWWHSEWERRRGSRPHPRVPPAPVAPGSPPRPGQPLPGPPLGSAGCAQAPGPPGGAAAPRVSAGLPGSGPAPGPRPRPRTPEAGRRAARTPEGAAPLRRTERSGRGSGRQSVRLGSAWRPGLRSTSDARQVTRPWSGARREPPPAARVGPGLRGYVGVDASLRWARCAERPCSVGARRGASSRLFVSVPRLRENRVISPSPALSLPKTPRHGCRSPAVTETPTTASHLAEKA